MCLAIKYDRKFKGNRGWKLLAKQNGTYQTGMLYVSVIQIGKDWADAGEERIESNNLMSPSFHYPAGFHIFTRKRDALRIWKHFPNLHLCKVQFKGQEVYGEVAWTWGYPTTTVVAKYCKLI